MQRPLRNALLVILLTSLCLACAMAWAEVGILVVHVQDVQTHPVAGLVIGVEGDGGSAVTDVRGVARIKLAPQTKVGSSVFLQILKSPPGQDLVIVSPWERRIVVPSFESETGNFVEVVVAQRGDRAALESGAVLKAAMQQINKANAPKSADKQAAPEDPKANLNAVAKHLGLSPEDVDKAIRTRTTEPAFVGANLYGVYFRNKLEGYVTYNSAPSTVCHTTDGGKTWLIELSPLPLPDVPAGLRGSASSSANLQDNAEVQVGKGGSITIINRAQRSRRLSPTTADLKAIGFGGDSQGFAVGTMGTALKTNDGGLNWFPILQGLEGQLLGDRKPRKLPAPWYYLSWLVVAAVAMRGLRKPPERELQSEETIADIAVSDRPLEPTDADPLGYKDLALSISRFLRNENTVAPITIAITGEWGTGKSSIMNLLRRDLASRGLRPIWFNAWHNQTEDDLFATILQAVRKQGVPQWWELDYLPFRARLLAIRWASRWQTATILLMAIAFLAGVEWQHRNDHSIANLFDSLKSWSTLLDSLKNLSKDTFWVFVVAVLYAVKHLYDGLKAFGVDPASLLASRSGTTSLSDLEKQTALRQKFAEELRDVTRALGARRRMVLFVDDLDRCMPDNIRVVLEAINFIVTSGECFVIMGLARRPVEAGVGLSFEKIAGEMTWSSTGAVEANEAKNERWKFSQQYLDKLINIEIPARPASNAKFENLILDDGSSTQAAKKFDQLLRRVLKIGLPLIVSALLVCSMALTGIRVGGSKSSGPSEIPSATNAPAKAPIGQSSAATPTVGVPASQASGVSGPKVVPLLKMPVQAANSSLTYAWPLLGAALLLYACWRIIVRKEEVVVRDSPKFRDALEAWDTVIIRTHATPRSTKRFMNKVRCLAMRLRTPVEGETRGSLLWRRSPDHPTSTTLPPTSRLPESTLVALSAIYDIAPEIVRNDQRYEKAMQGFLEPVSKGEVPIDSRVEAAFKEALERHSTRFVSEGEWPPTSEQRELFLDMCADVTVRG